MANNRKPNLGEQNVEGFRASGGGSVANQDIDDETDDGQGIRADGPEAEDDEDEVTESPASRRASVEGELGQGKQAGSEREGRGGRNARGR